jgi:hypothetical protein
LIAEVAICRPQFERKEKKKTNCCCKLKLRKKERKQSEVENKMHKMVLNSWDHPLEF